MNDNSGNRNGRIEVLKKREAEIRAKIAEERVRQQRREWKEYDRLKNIVGGALLAMAAEDQAFALHLKERLQKAVVVESDHSSRGSGQAASRIARFTSQSAV